MAQHKLGFSYSYSPGDRLKSAKPYLCGAGGCVAAAGAFIFLISKLVGSQKERIQQAIRQKLVCEPIIIKPKTRVERFVLMNKSDYLLLNSAVMEPKIQINLRNKENTKDQESFVISLG